MVAGTHNPKAINNAMAMICMFLGCRGGNELYKRCLGDLKVTNKSGIRYLTLSKERVMKTRSGENPRDIRFGLPTLRELKNNPQKCPVETFITLKSKRPVGYTSPDSPLFL